MSPSALGNSMDLSTKLWYRTFNRGADPTTEKPRPDTDEIATEGQLATDFVDHWGQLLQHDEEFRKLNTYNELIESFWGKFSLPSLAQKRTNPFQQRTMSLCRPLSLPMAKPSPRKDRNPGSGRSFGSCP